MVRPGYKQTEVGVIPDGWSLESVEEIATITTGSRNTQDRVADGKYPFFVRSQTVERINSFSYEGEAVLTAGDGVGTGKVYHYVPAGRFDVHQRVYRISDFRPDIVGLYFFLQFQSRFYDRIMQMTAKSSVDSVRREMIAGMQIPVPPTKAEQTAIATMLSDVDDLIEGLERLIDKKRRLMRGAMAKLLFGRRRLPGFERVKDAWTPSILRAHLRAPIRNGYSPICASARTGTWILSLAAVTSEGFDPRGVKPAPLGDPQVEKALLVKGDIVVSRSNTPERVGLAGLFRGEPSPCAYPDLMMRVQVGRSLSPEYLLYHLLSPHGRQYFARSARGSSRSMVKIDRSVLEEFEVPLPPTKAEQEAIAAVLSDMDAEIEALEAKLAKTRQLKQGMMHELLTGRIRLV